MTTIALVGNPNCGKTTLFNALTGANQRVGNWPGVTVEKKEGRYCYQGQEVMVVDLPGVYALEGEGGAVDEKIAREFLLSGTADLIINIVDASNLERNLYLTTQLLEIVCPLVLALNMMDVAEKRRFRIDSNLLAKRLGCPVIPMSAHRRKGVQQLKDVILRGNIPVPDAFVLYPAVIENAIADHENRWQALQELQFSETEERIAQREQILEELQNDLDLVLADARYTWIHDQLTGVVHRQGVVNKTLSDRIDQVLVNRWLGIPIFLAVMYVLFLIAINVGGAFIDFFEISTGTIFVDGVAHLLEQVNAPGWLIGLLAEGIGGGIQTTSTFIPQIGLLFIFLAILEDSGYMARAAFVMDRLMRWVGLSGKSFVPMLVGFGCNIPSIMSTRTLENQRDRLLTIVMNPFMSCGARLPVYALFCGAFFPKDGQNVVFILYIVGILAAIASGFLLKQTILKGEIAPFVLELPPYHLPTLGNILLRAWDRLKSFITRAGIMIITLVVILGMLNSVGIDGSFGKKDSQDSLLSSFSRTITPIFSPMGVREENWPATVGIFTGMFAKEVMVGTMNSLYIQLAGQTEAETEQEPYSFWGGMQKALQSIPEKLSELANSIFDPIGFKILQDIDDPEKAAETQEVKATTFGEMANRFGSTTAAIAFLLFVLMYFPCVSATAAVYRETNLGWTVFVAGWTTGLGYWTAVFYYQLMTWAEHPLSASLWLGGLIGVLLATVWVMYRIGTKQARQRRMSHAQ